MTTVYVGNDLECKKCIKKIIGEINFKTENDIDLKTYSSKDNLDHEVNNNDCYKIYIIDITKGNYKQCLKIIKKIRNIDWDNEIIVINNKIDLKEFNNSILKISCYIEKNNNYYEKLKNVIYNIFNKKYNNKMFIYNTRNSILTIYLKKIKYIVTDKDKRKLVLVSDNGTNYLPLCLKDVIDMLDPRFKLVHRCCIVNTERVIKYDFKNGNILFDSGETIDCLSKKYKNRIVS